MSRKGRPNMFILGSYISNKEDLKDLDFYDGFTHDKRSNKISLNISQECFDIICSKNKKYNNNLTEKISFIKKNMNIETVSKNINFLDIFKSLFKYEIYKENNIYSELFNEFPKVIYQSKRDKQSIFNYVSNYYSKTIKLILSDLRFKSQMACIYGSIINGTSLNKISPNKDIEYILHIFKTMFYNDLELMKFLDVDIIDD